MYQQHGDREDLRRPRPFHVDAHEEGRPIVQHVGLPSDGEGLASKQLNRCRRHLRAHRIHEEAECMSGGAKQVRLVHRRVRRGRIHRGCEALQVGQ